MNNYISHKTMGVIIYACSNLNKTMSVKRSPWNAVMIASFLRWGLLSQFLPFCYFSASPKSMLAIVYNVYIWQVSPQLSCHATCQIWMWWCDAKNPTGIFAGSKILLMEKLTNRALVTPTPIPYFVHIRNMKCFIFCVVSWFDMNDDILGSEWGN